MKCANIAIVKNIDTELDNWKNLKLNSEKMMIELKERGWWDPGEMKTHEMKFSEVNAAYDQYEQYQDEVIKVVMSI